jgi:septal ring factor EnvC (AmiA/AmiB activator)
VRKTLWDIRSVLRISKLQDKIKPLEKHMRQLIEKITLAEQQVDNMYKDIQYLESIKMQNNPYTYEESLAQD